MSRAAGTTDPPARPRSRLLPARTLSDQRRWAEAAGVGLVGAAGAFTLSAGLLTLGARLLARLPLTPQLGVRQRPDTAVRAIHPADPSDPASRPSVHLDATAESRRAGYLALRQSGGVTHVRLGPVDGRPTPTTVSRPLLASDGPEPLRVDRAKVNGFYWAGTPATAHDLPTEEVEIDSPVGRMPAWLVAPAPGPRDPAVEATWVIAIHGHGATRGEALRALPLLHRMGLTSLVITYRNDTGAPASADSMHHLGSEEWEDAEAAVEYALSQGARRIVLMGWSMGGGIALRTSVRSAHRARIVALVLDSPAVDWQDILVYHATALRAPQPMRRLALWMMTSRIGARMVRLHEPLALDEMSPEHYARVLRHPVLLFHALDDATVPPGPSRRLAALRPDLVTFEPFEGASHTREWNRDPVRYERLLGTWLREALGMAADDGSVPVPVRDPAAAPGERSVGTRL